jgi:hypothetical protein
VIMTEMRKGDSLTSAMFATVKCSTSDLLAL